MQFIRIQFLSSSHNIALSDKLMFVELKFYALSLFTQFANKNTANILILNCLIFHHLVPVSTLSPIKKGFSMQKAYLLPQNL